MVYAQPGTRYGEKDAHNFLGLLYGNGSLNLGQMTTTSDNQQKQRTCRIVDFAIPAGNRVKLKESEKKGKYLDLAG